MNEAMNRGGLLLSVYGAEAIKEMWETGEDPLEGALRQIKAESAPSANSNV